MPKQSLTIEVEVPEGWELTGEFRSPESGEVVLKGFLTGNGQAIRVVCSPMARYENCPILRKAEVWKPLTPEIAVDFYVTKKPITWRFRGCNSIAKKTFVTGLYTSAMGAPCICFPVQDDTLGLRHTIERIDYLEEDA